MKFPHPILETPTQPIDIASVKEQSVNQVFKYMISVLEKTTNGIALAGNQAGFNMSIFVHNYLGEPKAVLNPEFKVSPGIRPEKMKMPEGCLSLNPELFIDVVRYPVIVASYWEYPGMIQVLGRTIAGAEAQVFQHELDHLNGYTIITRPQLT